MHESLLGTRQTTSALQRDCLLSGSSGLALHGDGTPAIDPALTSTKLGDATIANLLMRFGTRLMQLGLSAAQLDRSIARLSIGLMAKAKGADLNDLAI